MTYNPQEHWYSMGMRTGRAAVREQLEAELNAFEDRHGMHPDDVLDQMWEFVEQLKGVE